VAKLLASPEVCFAKVRVAVSSTKPIVAKSFATGSNAGDGLD
jgi:hypothetical protein